MWIKLVRVVVVLVLALSVVVVVPQTPSSAVESEPRGLIAEVNGQGVYFFEKDGSGGRLVYSAQAGRGISWSPDGQSFVFSSRSNPNTGETLYPGGERLFVAPANGGPVTQITFDWCLNKLAISGIEGFLTPPSIREDENGGCGSHVNPQWVLMGGAPWIVFEWQSPSTDIFKPGPGIFAIPLNEPTGIRPGWIGYGTVPAAGALDGGNVYVEILDSNQVGTLRWSGWPTNCEYDSVSLLFGQGCFDPDVGITGSPDPVAVHSDADFPAASPSGDVGYRTTCTNGLDRVFTVRSVAMSDDCESNVLPPQSGAWNPDGERILSNSRVYDVSNGAEIELLYDPNRSLNPGIGMGNGNNPRTQAWQCEPDTCAAVLRIEKVGADLDFGPYPAIFSYSGDISGEIEWAPDPFNSSQGFTAIAYGRVTITETQATGWEPVSIECDAGNPIVDLATGTVSVSVTSGMTTCVFTSRGVDGSGLPDSDGDGVPDISDVCPGHPDTVDLNFNGVPDGCDAVPDECHVNGYDTVNVSTVEVDAWWNNPLAKDSQLYTVDLNFGWCHNGIQVLIDDGYIDPTAGVGDTRALSAFLRSFGFTLSHDELSLKTQVIEGPRESIEVYAEFGLEFDALGSLLGAGVGKAIGRIARELAPRIVRAARSGEGIDVVNAQIDRIVGKEFASYVNVAYRRLTRPLDKLGIDTSGPVAAFEAAIDEAEARLTIFLINEVDRWLASGLTVRALTNTIEEGVKTAMSGVTGAFNIPVDVWTPVITVTPSIGGEPIVITEGYKHPNIFLKVETS